MGASQNGCIEVVKILVVHHANVTARDLVRLYDTRILSLTIDYWYANRVVGRH